MTICFSTKREKKDTKVPYFIPLIFCLILDANIFTYYSKIIILEGN